MFDTIREIISKELNIEPDEINLDTNIVDDLGADSLALVSIVMSIEETLGITLSDEDASNVRTPADIIAIIENNEK